MKKTVVLIFFISFLLAVRSSAQNRNLERLDSYKVGFFTKRLNLSSSEAEKFWPVYNEYQEQRNLIQREKINLIRNFNQNESTLSDKQITEIGDKLISSITRESELAAQFHVKLKEVLSPSKVIRFYQAENQFKAQLLNELQNIQKQNRVPQNRLDDMSDPQETL